MNIAEILMLKYPKADFLKDIQLKDEGNGVYIGKWNLSDPKPNQQDLDKWAIEFDLPYRQMKATEQRCYPQLGVQFDMLYHDVVNGTTIWKDTIAAIKEKHPKPTN